MKAIFSGILALGSLAAARPGEVLNDALPELRTEATVEVAAFDSQGRVYLAGDFDSVDGVSLPGLARLKSDGTLDLAFEPSEGWSRPQTGVALFGGALNERVTMLPLPDGGLLMRDAERFQSWRSDGSVDDAFIADLREDPRPPDPQFSDGARVFVIRHQEARSLVAYRLDNGQADPTFQQEAFSLPPIQAVDGGQGKIWVLLAGEPSGDFFVSRPYSLARLNADGSRDESFAIRTLGSGRCYRLRPREGGGVDLLAENCSLFFYWPSPSRHGISWQRFDGAGEVVFERSFGVPFAYPASFFALGEEGEVVYPNVSGGHLIRGVWPFVDGSFLIPLPTAGLAVSERLPKNILSLLAVPSGGVVLGGVRRFDQNGMPTEAWHVARLERSGQVEVMKSAPDGSVIIAGNFDRVDGVERVGLARLQESGELEVGFESNFDGRFVTSLEQKPDGSWIAAVGPAMTDEDGFSSQLIHLDQGGSYLGLLAGRELGETSFQNLNNLMGYAMQSDGRIVWVSHSSSEVTTFHWSRLTPEGQEDPTFVFPSSSWYHDVPFVLRDDSFLTGGRHFGPNGDELGEFPVNQGLSNAVFEEANGDVLFVKSLGPMKAQIVRWRRASNQVEEFSEVLDFDAVSEVRADDRGKLLVMGRRYPNGFGQAETQIIRLHSTGQIDHSFQAPVYLNEWNFGRERARLVVQDDSILLAPSSDSEPLVRLARGHVAGFEQWIAAAAPNTTLQAASDDPDGDGCDNFEEYAAGTNPVDFRSHSRPRISGGLTWQVPCNPEAPEILRRLEGSSNGLDWSPVTGNDVRLEIQADCFTWSVFPTRPRFFTRLRIN